jgi:hypothetical protein
MESIAGPVPCHSFIRPQSSQSHPIPSHPIPFRLADTVISPRVYPTKPTACSFPVQSQFVKNGEADTAQSSFSERRPLRELARNVQLADADIGVMPNDGEAASLVGAFGFVAAKGVGAVHALV